MYAQIVVGADGSDGANVAADAAIELARLTGATLHVVNARRVADVDLAASQGGIPKVDLVAPDEAIRSEAQRICDLTVERADQVGVKALAHCVAGDPADALLKVAAETGADLVVVGNRGMSGVRRFVLGSVPNRLSHNCTSSLLIVDTAVTRARG
jgi:nucleotide-binding universal stress UspA family protein